MKKKKAVIFDMDGLMFDTQSMYDNAYRDIAREQYGIEVSAEFCKDLMGSTGVDMEKKINKFYPEIDAHKFVRDSFDLTLERVRTDLRPMVGLDSILEYLSREKYILAVASGSERRVLECNFQNSGVGHYFAASLCGDEVERAKPDPEMYIRTAAMIGCDPGDCYVLEDSFNGIVSGYRAGCTPIMVPSAVQPDEEIRAMCAGVYDTLEDVRAAFEKGEL